MAYPKIKENLNHGILENLGYSFNMMEGGYISPDRATVININRRPYERQVAQYRPNVEDAHRANLEQLQQYNILE